MAKEMLVAMKAASPTIVDEGELGAGSQGLTLLCGRNASAIYNTQIGTHHTTLPLIVLRIACYCNDASQISSY